MKLKTIYVRCSDILLDIIQRMLITGLLRFAVPLCVDLVVTMARDNTGYEQQHIGSRCYPFKSITPAALPSQHINTTQVLSTNETKQNAHGSADCKLSILR